MDLTLNLILEILAVGFNLIYLFLLMKERISCWYFGIVGSLISIFLFYRIGLYSESILYIYYVVIGIYGFKFWSKKSNGSTQLIITPIHLKKHFVFWIVIGTILAISLGSFFKEFTDATNPYLDAFTTIFSFIASYLEARKIISSWIYWMVINTATLVLYFEQQLWLYLALTLVYVVFSVLGYFEWKKKIEFQKL